MVGWLVGLVFGRQIGVQGERAEKGREGKGQGRLLYRQPRGGERERGDDEETQPSLQYSRDSASLQQIAHELPRGISTTFVINAERGRGTDDGIVCRKNRMRSRTEGRACEKRSRE